MEWVVGLAFWCLIWGGIAAQIGQRKNLGAGGSFALGALLGIIGVICRRQLNTDHCAATEN